MIPSDDSLLLHRKRTCWVLHMWKQADMNTMILKPMKEYGWGVEDNRLSIIWDSHENVQMIRERVSVLLKGCKCVTGCTTGRCSCKRKSKQCSEGCQCLNCTNINAAHDGDIEMSELVVEESQVHTNEINDEVDELMDWVFGEEGPVDWSELTNHVSEETPFSAAYTHVLGAQCYHS